MADGDGLGLGGTAHPSGSLSLSVRRGRPLTAVQQLRFFLRRFVQWL